MEKSKLNSLLKRVISALVLAPLVVWAIYYGWAATLILLLIVSALLSWEWSEMIPNRNKTVYAVTYLSAAVSTTAFIYPHYVYYPLSVIAGAALFVWLKAKNEKHRRLLTVGVPYIALGMGAFSWLYTWINPFAALWLLAAVWSVDIGGYVVGCTLKGPKLAPKISPNKTWAGLAGAIIFSVLTSLAFLALAENILEIPLNNEWQIIAAVSGAVLAVIAQVGDLLESKVKRYLKIKDSSNLIPGHGGIFDRLDGLLFAAPFVLIWFVLLIYYIAG